MIARSAIAIVLLAAGTARAGGIVDPPTSFHPPGRFLITATGSAHVLGNLSFAQLDRDLIADGSTAFTGSVALAVSVFVYENVELGAAVRYAPSIRFHGDEMAKRELDLVGRLAFHLQPWRKLDLSAALQAGYGHLTLADAEPEPDPTGLVIDPAVAASYPIGGGWWLTAGLGIEHGFQHTTSSAVRGMHADATYTTTFVHVDGGVAFRL